MMDTSIVIGFMRTLRQLKDTRVVIENMRTFMSKTNKRCCGTYRVYEDSGVKDR